MINKGDNIILKLLIKLTYKVTFLLVLLSLASPSNVYAQPLQDKQYNTITILSSKNNCSTTNDPKAPCRSEVFESVSIAQAKVAIQGVTKSVTCGVNIYNGVNTKVATLSETVRFTTGTSTMLYTVNSASRSTWVVNSLYSWGNLNGPSPSGGNVNYGSGPSTSGTLYYFSSPWNTWGTTLVVTSQSGSWYCR